MQQFTTYGVKIHMETTKPVRAMVCIYRGAVSFLNMEKLIQCKNCPEPLKSKGLRDLSQFSAVVLIVEKGRIS